MELYKEQVNLGRALTALGLEEQVAKNCVLSEGEITNRVSLVKGLVQGKLEQGEVYEALKMVFTDSAVKGLYPDRKELLQDAFEHLKRAKTIDWLSEEDSFEEEFKFFMDTFSAPRLYDMALLPNCTAKTAATIIWQLEKKKVLTLEQKRAAYLALGDEAFKREKFSDAVHHYETAEAKDKIEVVYQHIMTKKDPTNLKTAFSINDRHSSGQRYERAQEIIHAMIAAPKPDVAELEKLCRDYHVKLTPREDNILIDLHVVKTNDYDINEGRVADEVARRWAFKNWEKSPAAAYRAFKRLGISEPVVVEAAKKGLLHKSDRHEDSALLQVSEVDPTYLKGLYPQMPFDVRRRIACELKLNDELQNLSRESFEQFNKTKDDSFLTGAYNLWVESGGALDSPYVIDLREKLFATNREENSSFSKTSWLHYKDSVGRVQMAEKLLEKDPFGVYWDILREDRDDPVKQQVRQKMVARDPETAFDRFNFRKDTIGLDLAVTALAKKYDVPQKLLTDAVLPYLNKS